MGESFKCEWEGCGAEFDSENKLRGHMMHHKSPRGRTEEKSRKERIPLGVRKMKGSVSIQIPGKCLRWVNDNWRKHPDRIQAALAAGYEFATRDGMTIGEEAVDGNQDLGSRVSGVCGTNADGTPITRYLMAIDEKYFQEDQAAKQAELDETDKAIRAGKYKNTLGQFGYVAKSNFETKIGD